MAAGPIGCQIPHRAQAPVAGAASLPERGRAVAAKGGACWGTPRRRPAHLGTEFVCSVGGGTPQARAANGFLQHLPSAILCTRGLFQHEVSPETSHFRLAKYGLHGIGTAARRAHSHRGGHALELLGGSVHPEGRLRGACGELHSSSGPRADEPEQSGRRSEQVPPPTRAALQF